jgi:hypothetical protein
MAERLNLISENIIDDQEKSGSLLCDILQDHHPVTINIAFLDHAFHHGSLPRSIHRRPSHGDNQRHDHSVRLGRSSADVIVSIPLGT